MGSDGLTYLTWVAGVSVCFVELAQPNDAIESLMRYLHDPAPSAVTRVPVGNLVGHERLKNAGGVNALFLEIEVVGIGSDASGRMVLRVAGRDAGSVHSFVQEGTRWRIDAGTVGASRNE